MGEQERETGKDEEQRGRKRKNWYQLKVKVKDKVSQGVVSCM